MEESGTIIQQHREKVTKFRKSPVEFVFLGVLSDINMDLFISQVSLMFQPRELRYDEGGESRTVV